MATDIYTLKSLSGTTLFNVDSDGNVTMTGNNSFADLTATGNTALGNGAADTTTITGHVDIDSARTTAGSGLDIDGTINSASAAFSGLDITSVQLTTARTSGTVNGVKVATTSLAGDLNSVVYADYRAAAPTDGGGSAVHAAIVVEAGHDVALDLSAAATGESDIVIGDNLADAFTIREAANSYLQLVSTNSEERVVLGKRLAQAPATITMGNADVVLTTATLIGNIVFASCTTGTHDLTFPSPTTYSGFEARVYNVGGQSIVLKDNGGSAMKTLTAGGIAIVGCNGSAWVAGLLA